MTISLPLILLLSSCFVVLLKRPVGRVVDERMGRDLLGNRAVDDRDLHGRAQLGA